LSGDRKVDGFPGEDEIVTGVVVTGSNGGIGTAITEVLIENGYFVIGSDVGPDRSNLGAYIDCDLKRFVAEPKLRDEFVRNVETMLAGRQLTALVNNAASLENSDLKTLQLSDFLSTMDVNVTAVLGLSQALLSLLEQSNGAIVNIGSIHAKLTKPGFVSYATSKAALRGLTQAMAVECGASIRVNVIEPAAIATPMLLAGFANNPALFEGLEDYHPVGRIGQPREVADMVDFLISGKSRFMNGAVIELDGGIGVRLHDPV
jgi:NAD(P)-dependent dehydrogenase (short-subunit alcohol dehydrogenase family)